MTPTYLAKSDGRLFPMTEQTWLGALQQCGSKNPHADLQLIQEGRTVRRRNYSFKILTEATK